MSLDSVINTRDVRRTRAKLKTTGHPAFIKYKPTKFCEKFLSKGSNYGRGLSLQFKTEAEGAV
jgi:hypothetical protein